MSPWAFAGRFLAGFAALSTLAELARLSPLEPVLLRMLLLEPAARLLNLVGSPAEVYGRSLVGENAQLNILRGCDGLETLTLSIAAIAAFPVKGSSRLGPLVGAVLLGWVLCILRIAGLFWALRNVPLAWPAIHGALAPLLPVAVLSAFFAWWVRSRSSHGP